MFGVFDNAQPTMTTTTTTTTTTTMMEAGTFFGNILTSIFVHTSFKVHHSCQMLLSL
jgi:hypothetical protein